MNYFESTADFEVGDRVKAFHPHTLGVMHWATVTKVGTKWLHVRWHVTDAAGKVRPSDVSERERPRPSEVERERRDRRATALAAGHPFRQSPATENVCGDCGAHVSYHEDTAAHRPDYDPRRTIPYPDETGYGSIGR